LEKNRNRSEIHALNVEGTKIADKETVAETLK
jgi:hypothetical protein